MQKDIAGFKIEVTRKKMKNIRLSVHPGAIIKISAPERVPYRIIEQFVLSHREWILHKQKEMEKIVPTENHEYKNGDSVYLFGRELVLEISYGEKRSVACDGDTMKLIIKPDDDPNECRKLINGFYKMMLEKQIERCIPVYEEKTGLYSSSWHIRNMKTRWGSCNVVSRRICINLQLAKFPVECLEYVLLHELAHIAVSNHGPEFKALLDRYMPDWRDLKDRLNREYIHMQ